MKLCFFDISILKDSRCFKRCHSSLKHIPLPIVRSRWILIPIENNFKCIIETFHRPGFQAVPEALGFSGTPMGAEFFLISWPRFFINPRKNRSPNLDIFGKILNEFVPIQNHIFISEHSTATAGLLKGFDLFKTFQDCGCVSHGELI